ncbi:hypothetical protein STEG23_015171, partial [Scotinomys teguina]
ICSLHVCSAHQGKKKVSDRLGTRVVDDSELPLEYYAAEKNNDIMKFAGKWMELENVILSEVTQTQKDKHGIYSLIEALNEDEGAMELLEQEVGLWAAVLVTEGSTTHNLDYVIFTTMVCTYCSQ